MKTSSERAVVRREAGDAVRVAFIGAGANSRELHIPGLQAIPGVKVVGVSNRSVASGRKVAEQFGIPTVYASWRELLDDPAVNAVVVGTWPDSHAMLTCAALESGKHVLCEARMARDVTEARQMLQTSEAFPISLHSWYRLHLRSDLIAPFRALLPGVMSEIFWQLTFAQILRLLLIAQVSCDGAANLCTQATTR